MQDQRIPGAPSDAPQLGSHEHDVQRRMLLELLISPLPDRALADAWSSSGASV
jgi:hypothetical protein